MNIFRALKHFTTRNRTDLMHQVHKQGPQTVQLEWWSARPNVGDALSPVIVNWMMEQQQLDPAKGKPVHLLAVGSIIGPVRFDAVIWGAGILDPFNIANVIRHSWYVKYDIRAVRGPITRSCLQEAGYDCPEVYGDPAVLMPLIYQPEDQTKKYPVSVILHFSSSLKPGKDVHQINVETDDYKDFIDQLTASEKIISSSLHGIILAEAYGIPAVFLNQDVTDQSLKYLDWYYSTGRKNIKMASTLEEALRMEPMELPDLRLMQQQIQDAFPTDLWHN